MSRQAASVRNWYVCGFPVEACIAAAMDHTAESWLLEALADPHVSAMGWGLDDLVPPAVKKAVSGVVKTIGNNVDAVSKAVNHVANTVKGAVVAAGTAVGNAVVEGAKAAGRALVSIAKAIANSQIAREMLAWSISLAVQIGLCSVGIVLPFPPPGLCVRPDAAKLLRDVLAPILNAALDCAIGKVVDWIQTVTALVQGLIGFINPGPPPPVPTPMSCIQAVVDAFKSGSAKDILAALKQLWDVVLKPVLSASLKASGRPDDAKKVANVTPANLSKATMIAGANVPPDLRTNQITLAQADHQIAVKAAAETHPVVKAAEAAAAAQTPLAGVIRHPDTIPPKPVVYSVAKVPTLTGLPPKQEQALFAKAAERAAPPPQQDVIVIDRSHVQ